MACSYLLFDQTIMRFYVRLFNYSHSWLTILYNKNQFEILFWCNDNLFKYILWCKSLHDNVKSTWDVINACICWLEIPYRHNAKIIFRGKFSLNLLVSYIHINVQCVSTRSSLFISRMGDDQRTSVSYRWFINHVWKS